MENSCGAHEIITRRSSDHSGGGSSSSTTTSTSTSSNTANDIINRGSSRRYGINTAASHLMATLLEYSAGILSPSSSSSSGRSVNDNNNNALEEEDEEEEEREQRLHSGSNGNGNGNDHGEVTIRIVGRGEQPEYTNNAVSDDVDVEEALTYGSYAQPAGDHQANLGDAPPPPPPHDDHFLHSETTTSSLDDAPSLPDPSSPSSSSSYQRYDMQNLARLVENILPFSLLLLLVFLRQHLQGLCVTLWIAAVMFKSNDFIRKQTALKGERKIFFLMGMSVVFLLHVISVYWLYRNDNLLYSFALLPPIKPPPFWNALFITVVNDVMVRQIAMIFKCMLLMYYKNSKSHNYRKQGQMLTLVEYLFLLYRVLLPTPVWYRYFLNKEYGTIFSSFVTGLYLTFKLTSVLSKARLFFAALRALSRKEMYYGVYATPEQVNAMGDLCAICQEKMQAPVLLRCRHIFCEECVSEWFERERTCPLCRAVVRPADIRSYSDGSTSLYFQLF
ncbi:hypothetical protein Tsubulata_025320 [Turnera subulata]|uniref:RING-type domain-containing protein n=1 Tax=Turnera subulata TaxID=218843 RepID=A0A9Q0FE27_9ROSI|nr:hypothetical protein Tsubulata_025320 [Turnera subulata]